MAKPKPKKVTSASSTRRDRMASFELARKKEQKRRTIGLLAICVVLACALLAYPVYLLVDDARSRSAAIGDIGAKAAAADCTAAEENAATGNQQHVADGTKVDYDRLPPDSGPHYGTWAPFTKKFYTMGDRPPVENLVHNLEHGYLVAWYRDGMPDEQVDDLQQISKTFASAEQIDKFIAAPWTEADGGPFPDGKNVVLTRWYANPQNPGDAAQQKGIRESCGQVSGEVVRDFMAKYPYTDSPEPNGG